MKSKKEYIWTCRGEKGREESTIMQLVMASNNSRDESHYMDMESDREKREKREDGEVYRKENEEEEKRERERERERIIEKRIS